MGQLAYNDTMIEVNDDGFLVNADDWNEDLAGVLAQGEDITLTDEHWKVINFMRQEFAENGKVPSIRRLKKAGGIPIKDIYRLFPDGPAKKAAKIAGLSKPEGCV